MFGMGGFFEIYILVVNINNELVFEILNIKI